MAKVDVNYLLTDEEVKKIISSVNKRFKRRKLKENVYLGRSIMLTFDAFTLLMEKVKRDIQVKYESEQVEIRVSIDRSDGLCVFVIRDESDKEYNKRVHDEIVKRTTKKAQTILNKREQEEKKKQRQIQSLKKIMNELGDGVYEAFAKINDSTPKI